MLAYLLWHRPRHGSATRAVYETSLLAFHERLKSSNIEGLVDSSTYSVSPLPWLTNADCHEDWYLLSSWSALGSITDASVSGQRKVAHDLAAHLSVIEAGAMYKLRAGECNLDTQSAVWFAKPDNMAYWVLDELLEPYARAPGCGIWQRQLALGPSFEFCLLGASELDLKDLTQCRSTRTRLTLPRSSYILH